MGQKAGKLVLVPSLPGSVSTELIVGLQGKDLRCPSFWLGFVCGLGAQCGHSGVCVEFPDTPAGWVHSGCGTSLGVLSQSLLK